MRFSFKRFRLITDDNRDFTIVGFFEALKFREFRGFDRFVKLGPRKFTMLRYLVGSVK